MSSAGCPMSATCTCSRTAARRSASPSAILTARSTRIPSCPRSSSGSWPQRRVTCEKTGRCLYCDVIEGERGGERTVLRDERWIAFVPPFARWPYEVHLAPIAHRGGLADLDADDDESFARTLKGVLQKYDRLFDRPLPYVMAMHQKPPGRGSQAPPLSHRVLPAQPNQGQVEVPRRIRARRGRVHPRRARRGHRGGAAWNLAGPGAGGRDERPAA